MTVRSALVATKVPSRNTFIAPPSSGNSEVLATFAVRNAAGWSFGVVRYSGFAASAAVVTGIFCGELSLGTLEGAEILKEALVAVWSTVAWARVAPSSIPPTAPSAIALAEAGAPRRVGALSKDIVCTDASAVGIGRGTNTSTVHGRTSGAAPPMLGRAVESVSATSFQSSPVFCRTRA